MSLVSAKGLSKHYRLGETVIRALREVSLDVAEREFVAIVGPSGSGKTTLLNLIGCLDSPTAGDVLIEGRRTADLSADQLAEVRSGKLGFIFQTFNLIPVLTAAENVEYPLLFQSSRPGGKRRKAMVEEVFDKLGISKLADHRPPQLSGGERQKVAIARAVITRPKLILADEPTANLDSHSGQEIIRLMQRLHREEGTSVLFSTHDPRIVRLARRVIHLRDGSLADPESAREELENQDEVAARC